MSEQMKSTGPHDLGGLPGGDIDRAEHDYAFWERRVDAMVYLLFTKGVVNDWSQIRHHIEQLGPDVYNSLSYYERWAGATATLLDELGVVSRQELEQRLQQLENGEGS